MKYFLGGEKTRPKPLGGQAQMSTTTHTFSCIPVPYNSIIFKPISDITKTLIIDSKLNTFTKTRKM